jgi:hypothetical protein
LRGLKGWHEAEQNTGGEREPDGKDKHAHVQPDFVHRWCSVRSDGNKAGDPPDCDEETQGTANGGEKHAFGQQLSQHTTSCGPERHADGNLARARRGTGEQEVRDVHAPDQQDEANGADEHQQSQPDIADDLVAERDQVDAGPRIEFRILLLELSGERGCGSTCLFERKAVAEPRDNAKNDGAA